MMDIFLSFLIIIASISSIIYLWIWIIKDLVNIRLRRKTYREDLAEISLKAIKSADRINNMINRSVINPVLTDLKELRNNTWDLERIDRIYDWLERWKEQSSKDYEISQSEDKDD